VTALVGSPEEAGAQAKPAPASGSFRGPVLRGLAWQSATRGTFELSRIVVAMVLARLLTPHQYGIAGMVLLVLSLEPVLSGTGLASGLIQREVITEQDKSTVFWVNTAVGLLVCMTFCAASGLVADFYREPAVQPLFVAMSFDFLLASLVSVQTQLLIRDMDFKSLEMRSISGVIAGAVAAVIIAAAGGGPWALVGQQLTFSVVSLALLWRVSPWRPRLMFSRKSLRELRGFGGNVSGTMVMAQLTGNTDNLLIGRFLGAYSLGLYALGYNLIFAPVGRISQPLIAVFYPVICRVQNDLQRVASLWLRILRLSAAVAVPATLGLIVVAPDIVPVVFGHRWQAAAPVIQILAGIAFLYGIQGINGIVLMATNHTRLVFRFSCLQFALCLGSFVLGLHWGIIGVAGCFAAVTALIQPVYMKLTADAIGTTLWSCAKALSGVAQASAASTLAAVAARELLLALDVGPGPRSTLVIVVGILVYVPTCAWRAPDVLQELRQLRAAKGSKEGAAVVAP
jgi:O-antigen/teichoic acid export membrane protein